MPHHEALNLLVVDDHEAFRHTIRQMFEGGSERIVEASSGEDALELFKAGGHDWVIMDLRMPGMGGLKATQAIRNVDPRARVILISEFNEADLREQAQHAGAVGFMSKENVSSLARIIREPFTQKLNPFFS